MSAGVYSALALVYFQTIGYNFKFARDVHWLLKLPAFLIAFVYCFPLVICGLFFQILIILDWLSSLVSNIRNGLLKFLESASYKVRHGFAGFLFAPIAIMCVCPLLFISFLLPKLSSNDVDEIVSKAALGGFTGAGAFKSVSHSILESVKNTFFFVSQANVFFMPFLGVIALTYSVILVGLGLIFIVLIPLDWISTLIEGSRRYILLFAANLRDSAKYKLIGFLGAPILLLCLAPLFFIILIIPKFTSHIEA